VTVISGRTSFSRLPIEPVVPYLEGKLMNKRVRGAMPTKMCSCDDRADIFVETAELTAAFAIDLCETNCLLANVWNGVRLATRAAHERAGDLRAPRTK
jgi:hypothetical protein